MTAREWNKRFPVGTRVRITCEASGQPRLVRTRSRAWQHPLMGACVLVEGVAYAIQVGALRV